MEQEKTRKDKMFGVSYAHFIHDTHESFLSPVLPLLIEKLGINFFTVGLITLIYRIPSFAMPLLGILADRMKVRYFVIFTPAFTAILMCLLGIAPNIYILTIMLFFVGLSSALFHVPSPVMMKMVSGNKVGIGMSLFAVGGEMARTVGPIIILGAVSLWGFEGTYRLIPLGIISSFFLFFMLRKIEVSKEMKKKSTRISETIKLFMPLIVIIIGFNFFTAIMKTSLTVYLPTYLKFKGESLWFAGISLSVFELAGVAGTLLSGFLSDKIGRKRLLLIVSIISPILMYLFSISNSYYVFPLLILLGIFIFASTPVILAMVVEVKSDRPSFINSIYMAISFVIAAIATLLVGLMADYFNLQNTYEISSVIAFGTIPFVLMIKDKK
jgi:FSR family fosmidomycin resistance protein-like MFS transporter